jgi:ABC-type transporter Mla subunit MlaD
MKLLLIFILVLGIALVECTRDECYHLEIQFANASKIQKDNPVFYGDGLIGHVNELSKMPNDSTIANLCILDTVAIPKKSVLVSGFIKVFGMNGIQVIPSPGKRIC